MRVWFWLILAATIVGTSVPRLGHHTWIWQAGSSAAREYGGTPLEWEWVDLAQSAWFAEGDPRWQGRLDPAMNGQNMLRFLPGLAVSWLGAWTGEAYVAAVLLTWLCWLAAAAAVYALALRLVRPAARGRQVGVVAASLVVLSPGFTAFFGNIDAHPFGYAAAPLALLVLECACGRRTTTNQAASRAPSRLQEPLVVGAMLFLANATLELAPPLLALLWLYYVLLGAGRVPPGNTGLKEKASWAARATTTYFTLQSAWWLIARAAALGHVVGHNEGLLMAFHAVQATAHGLPSAQDVRGVGLAMVGSLTGIFTPAVAVLFVPGVLLLPRRSGLWCLIWLALIVGVAIFTRNVARVQYLAFPAVYLAAATAVVRAGAMLATLGRFARSGALEWLLRWSAAAALLALVGHVVLADVAGDLTMVYRWWPPS